MIGRTVVELDHTCAYADGLRTVVVRALEQADDSLLVLTVLQVVRFTEPVGYKELINYM